MRVLANFSKKVSTGDYENETYTVSVECETEFNEVPKVADYLFHEAKDAVARQINGSPGQTAVSIPSSIKSNGSANSKEPLKLPPKTQSKNFGHGNGNGKNSDAKMTDAQRRYLFRLLAERGLEGEKAHQTLKETFNVTDLKTVPKLHASKLIEDLVNGDS